MSDDFCLEHGHDFMTCEKGQIPYCKKCEAGATVPIEVYEALRPFVKWIEKADGPLTVVVDRGDVRHDQPGILADAKDDYVLLRLDPSCPPVTVGHFRNARAAFVEASKKAAGSK